MLGVSSCSKTMSADAYLKYIESPENGYRKVVQVDGWEYTFQYKPYEYILCKEFHGLKKSELYKKRMEQLKGTAWFNIYFKRIADTVSPLRYRINSLDEYNQRLTYYLSSAAGKLKLYYGKDTLTTMSYLFETNYNLTPQETMVVGFALPVHDESPQRDMQISYHDVVFNNGIIKSKFEKALLINNPNIID